MRGEELRRVEPRNGERDEAGDWEEREGEGEVGREGDGRVWGVGSVSAETEGSAALRTTAEGKLVKADLGGRPQGSSEGWRAWWANLLRGERWRRDAMKRGRRGERREAVEAVHCLCYVERQKHEDRRL